MTKPGWGPLGPPGSIEILRSLLHTGCTEEPFPGVERTRGLRYGAVTGEEVAVARPGRRTLGQ